MSLGEKTKTMDVFGQEKAKIPEEKNKKQKQKQTHSVMYLKKNHTTARKIHPSEEKQEQDK